MVVSVYRAKGVTGSVRARRDGTPDLRMWVPKHETHVVLGEIYKITKAFLDLGANYVFNGVHGVPRKVRTHADAEALLSKRIRSMDCTMTANHTFGSCRMSGREDEGVVDLHGKVHGVEGLWLADASIFPSPTAVNPQATVMAMSDLITREIAGLKD